MRTHHLLSFILHHSCLSISRAHTQAIDAYRAVAQSRKSRGFFDVLLRRTGDTFAPTYNYKADGSACRVYGSMEVKKVTGSFPLLQKLTAQS